jgi:putative flippase GtrA
MDRSRIRQVLGFGIVGTIGFLVDGGVLTALSQWYGIDVFISRVPSFVIATVVTWLLNRTFVFQANNDGDLRTQREYSRYLLVQVGGGLLNFGIYSLLLKSFSVLHSIPVVPLAAGSAGGMLFNYSGTRRWVFRKTADR